MTKKLNLKKWYITISLFLDLLKVDIADIFIHIYICSLPLFKKIFFRKKKNFLRLIELFTENINIFSGSNPNYQQLHIYSIRLRPYMI